MWDTQDTRKARCLASMVLYDEGEEREEEERRKGEREGEEERAIALFVH
jgi:hypothetical protein